MGFDFVVGDKIRRKDGEPFSMGDYIATVKNTSWYNEDDKLTIINGGWLYKDDVELVPAKPLLDVVEDLVNQPNHYTAGGIEVIDVLKAKLPLIKDGYEGYLVGNIIKYTTRYNFKNGVQDLEKAQNYTAKLIAYKKEKGE